MSRTHLANTRKVGKYQPLGPLDKGGMGRVFNGRIEFPLCQRRPCAIKYIRDDRHDARYLALFLREAMIGWDVSGHPNIVTTRNFVQQEDGRLFIVLDKEGPALDRCMEELQGRNTRIRAIAENILFALRHLRRKRVAHGDLSPANILLSRDGVAKLSDFGLARHEDEILSERFESPSYGFVGIPEYASPEVASGGRRNHRADLYSLGAVLYQLVTGRPRSDASKPLPERTPSDLIELITGLLQHEPDDRLTVEDALAIVHQSDQLSTSREEIARIATEWIAKDEAEQGQPTRVETAVKWFDVVDAHLRRWPPQMQRREPGNTGQNTNGAPTDIPGYDVDARDGLADNELLPAQPSAGVRRPIAPLSPRSRWLIAAAMASIALVVAIYGMSRHSPNPSPVALETVTAPPTPADPESTDAVSPAKGDAQEQHTADVDNDESAASTEPCEPCSAVASETGAIEFAPDEAAPDARHTRRSVIEKPMAIRGYRDPRRTNGAQRKNGRVYRRYKLDR